MVALISGFYGEWGSEGKVKDVLKSSEVSVSENLEEKSIGFLSKRIEALAVRQPNQTNPRSSADDSAGPLYTAPGLVEPKTFVISHSLYIFAPILPNYFCVLFVDICPSVCAIRKPQLDVISEATEEPSTAGMAEYLASIFGTEKDKVNCSFFFKVMVFKMS